VKEGGENKDEREIESERRETREREKERQERIR